MSSQYVTDGSVTATGSVVVASGSFATDLQVEPADAGSIRSGQIMVRLQSLADSTLTASIAVTNSSRVATAWPAAL